MINLNASENFKFCNQDAAIACLYHVREMLLHAAGIRSKNFNFFLVAAGIIMLAITKADGLMVILVTSVGVILSVIFIILDVRTFQLIKDARHDLERIEPLFGINIHTVDQVPDRIREKKGVGRFRLISHTFGYRAVFSMFALLFLVWGFLHSG